MTDDAEEVGALRLVAVTPVNSSAVVLEVSSQPNSTLEAETSLDGSIWSPARLEGMKVGALEAGRTYSFRVKSGSSLSNVQQATIPASKLIPNMCEYKGRNYSRGRNEIY